MIIKNIPGLRNFSSDVEGAARLHIGNFLKGTRYTIQKVAQASLRFVFSSIPLQRIALIQQLARREIKPDQKAIHLTHHIPFTKAGKAVGDFAVGPKVSFQLQPLDPRQMAKARQLKEEWRAKSLSPALSEQAKLQSREKVRQFENLLSLASQQMATTQDFERADWEAYDAVNFELTKEHLKNLATVFASQPFINNKKPFTEWNVDLPESMVAEVLAKSLAYSEGHHGKVIHLPAKQGMVPYVIQEFHFGKALPGYILEPLEGSEPAWVVARGTQTLLKKDKNGRELRKGARESIMADLNPESMTRDAVDSALKQQALKKIIGDGRQIKLAGHSLGGALVTDFATRYPEQIAKAYTFSAPGMSRFEAGRWNAKLEAALVAFDVKGDLVPGAGHFVKGLHIEIAQDKLMHPFVMHNAMILNKPFKAAVIDTHKENQRMSRQRMAAFQRLQMRLIAAHQRQMAVLAKFPYF